MIIPILHFGEVTEAAGSADFGIRPSSLEKRLMIWNMEVPIQIRKINQALEMEDPFAAAFPAATILDMALLLQGLLREAPFLKMILTELPPSP